MHPAGRPQAGRQTARSAWDARVRPSAARHLHPACAVSTIRGARGCNAREGVTRARDAALQRTVDVAYLAPTRGFGAPQPTCIWPSVHWEARILAASSS